jgi:chorismate mutase
MSRKEAVTRGKETGAGAKLVSEPQGAAALDRCRDEIDELDRRIVALLNDRARIVERIGEIKQHLAMRVYEPKREDAVFANIAAGNRGPLGNEALRRIYERLLDEMRTLQRDRMKERENQRPGDPSC